MVPERRMTLPSIIAGGIQYALAVVLLAIPQVTDHPWLFYSYYGAGIAVVPLLFRVVSGREFRPLQRLYFSLGLSLHPFSMYLDLYPAFWWWDVLAHFVSGSLLAAGLYLVLRGGRGLWGDEATATRRIHLLAVLGVLAGGVAWEVYEVFAPWLTIYGRVDIVKDVLVALVAWTTVARVQDRLFGPIPRGTARRLDRFRSGGSGSVATEDSGSGRAVTDGGSVTDRSSPTGD